MNHARRKQRLFQQMLRVFDERCFPQAHEVFKVITAHCRSAFISPLDDNGTGIAAEQERAPDLQFSPFRNFQDN